MSRDHKVAYDFRPVHNAIDLAELARLVGEQLGRFGVAGRVVPQDEFLVLVGHGPSVRLSIAAELEQFRSASESQRRHVAERLARELSSQRRASQRAPSSNAHLLGWLRVVPGLLVVGAGIYGAWYWLGRPAQQALANAQRQETGHNEPDHKETARQDLQSPENAANGSARKVPIAGRDEKSAQARCDGVRTRIGTGGTVTALDVDGWVVELSLLSEAADLAPDRKLPEGFIAREPKDGTWRIAFSDDPALSSVHGTGTLVQVSREPLVSVVPGTHGGIRMVLTGAYVQRYFSEEGRLGLVRFSAALFDAVHARHGALYARCAEGRSHHLGSWFRGTDWATVGVSLTALMGLYGDLPHFQGVGLTEDPLEQRRALSLFLDQARKFQRAGLTMLLAQDGGMLASRPGQWSTITFPFSDGNRATRASLRLTQSVGLGPHR